MAFADNLKKMPGVAHLEAIRLLEGEEEVGLIEHKPGQVGSLTLYNHLAQTYGAITADAARAGLELYAEHAQAESREARFVRVCDRLQLGLRLLGYRRRSAWSLKIPRMAGARASIRSASTIILLFKRSTATSRRNCFPGK